MRPLRSTFLHGAPLTSPQRPLTYLGAVAVPSSMKALCDSHYPAPTPATRVGGRGEASSTSAGPLEGGGGAGGTRLASWQRGWTKDQPIILEDDSDPATPPASASANLDPCPRNEAQVERASTQLSQCSLDSAPSPRKGPPPPVSPPRPSRQQRRPLLDISPTQTDHRSLKTQRLHAASHLGRGVETARKEARTPSAPLTYGGRPAQSSRSQPRGRHEGLSAASQASKGWKLGDAIRFCDELTRSEDPLARMDEAIRALDADKGKGKARSELPETSRSGAPPRSHAASGPRRSGGSSILHPRAQASSLSSSSSSIHPRAVGFTSSRRSRKSWGSTWGGGGSRRYQSSYASSKEMRKTELERGLDVYTLKRPVGSIPWASTTSEGEDSTAPSPKVHVTRSLDEAERLLDSIELGTPLSVDLEWPCNLRTGRSGKVAIVQVASPGSVVVIQLKQMGKVPQSLRRLMEDDSTMKCGVAIVADGKKLHRDWGVVSRSLVELSTLAKHADTAHWAGRHTLISLRDLTRIYLGRKLLKDSVRTSNWEKAELDPRQIEYAACDVYSGLEIYFTLLKRIDDQAAGRLVSSLHDEGSREPGRGDESRSDETADRLRSNGGWFSREIELMADAAAVGPEGVSVSSTSTVVAASVVSESTTEQREPLATSIEIPIFKPPKHSTEALKALRQSSFDLHRALEHARAAKEAARKRLEAATAEGAGAQAQTSKSAASAASVARAASSVSTTPGLLSHQRAYTFWLEGKTLAEVACLMRSDENPLALSTVGGYVLRALTESKEELSERDLKRARAVAMRPEVKVARARLKWPLRKAGIIDGPGSDSSSAPESTTSASASDGREA